MTPEGVIVGMPDSNASSTPPTDSSSFQPRRRALFLALIAIVVVVTWSRSQNAEPPSGTFRSGLFEMSESSSTPSAPPALHPKASESPKQPESATLQYSPATAPTTDTQKTAPPQINTVEETAINDTAARLIGRWEDHFYGHRIFDFAEGGKAEMVIKLDSVGALLYGPQLKFYIDWTLDGDVLTLKMTGGEPSDTAKTVSQIFGETSQQRIEAINDQEMKLRSLDSQKLYTHKRLSTSE